MRDEEIIEFIRNLENEVPKDGAEAQFVSFGEIALYANKTGYLRMALELMKCAFNETYKSANLNYLFGEDSEFGIEHLTVTKEQLGLISS